MVQLFMYLIIVLSLYDMDCMLWTPDSKAEILYLELFFNLPEISVDISFKPILYIFFSYMKGIKSYELYAIALSTGLIAIYTYKFNHYAIIFSVPLIWISFLSSANSVRSISSYGIGTGVASIGMLGTGVGTVCGFVSNNPIIAIGAGFVIGFLVGLCANKIIKMNIPQMELNIGIMSSSVAIIITLMMYIFNKSYLIYPLLFGAVAIAIIHPYNGSMGAGENQSRTLKLSATEASMTTGLFGLVAMSPAIIAVSAIGFIIFLYIWINSIKDEVYKIEWTGIAK
ncbi:MAG: tetrahydromethanopterin S-methyltransferase subunit C [Methanosarcinales archaeon]